MGQGTLRAGEAAMGAYADAAVIMWDGQSKGAADMAWNMRMLGKPVHQVFVELMDYGIRKS
jgi:hypothetical protein